MRAFAKLTRWTTLILFLVMVVSLFYLVSNSTAAKASEVGIFLVCGSGFLLFWSFIIMVVSNIAGACVTSDRHDRADIYASKQYRVKLEN
jgi:hypothetical protein